MEDKCILIQGKSVESWPVRTSIYCVHFEYVSNFSMYAQVTCESSSTVQQCLQSMLCLVHTCVMCSEQYSSAVVSIMLYILMQYNIINLVNVL
jgi:hypothetical protein